LKRRQTEPAERIRKKQKGKTGQQKVNRKIEERW
jgi:hypothetical protein